ncbi:hypothetical protein H0X06_06910 [Candidatus Dependentiae bacterium]|nr:hypothetical protein [Candidatus Dependentiae bacterium]
MKKILSISLCVFCVGMFSSIPLRGAPLNDPILRSIDGLPFGIDKAKIEKMLWAIKELKNTQNGIIKVSALGEPDPSRSSITLTITFNGKKQDIKSLMELEKQIPTSQSPEKIELEKNLQLIRNYIGKINLLLLADAQGTEDIMMKLINEFCRNRNRHDSFLLNWKHDTEMELYNSAAISFKMLHAYSEDLMKFLADLVMSCPKALKAYNDSIKKPS